MNITQLPVRPAAQGAAVRTTGLTKRYGDRTVVDDLSITVPSGTVCGFIGRNGAGKTTTIRMLLGLIRPGSGTAEVLGQSIDNPRAYLPQVGAMIEGPAFYPTLTARKNLEALRRLGSLPASSIDRSLEIVGLADRSDEPVKGFSLGMRQRLGIAAALLPEPSLLILDEPTNGLDPQGIRETRLLLRALADQGMTVLVSSHLLDELQHISDHLVLINQGRLTFEGTADALMQRAETELVARADTADGTERLAAVLRSSKTEVEVVDGSLRIGFDGSLTAAALNRLAHNHGIVLEHLNIERPRLEDIFFSMTNADNGDSTHQTNAQTNAETNPQDNAQNGALAS